MQCPLVTRLFVLCAGVCKSEKGRKGRGKGWRGGKEEGGAESERERRGERERATRREREDQGRGGIGGMGGREGVPQAQRTMQMNRVK